MRNGASVCARLFASEQCAARLDIACKLKRPETIEKHRRRDGIPGAAYEWLVPSSIS